MYQTVRRQDKDSMSLTTRLRAKKAVEVDILIKSEAWLRNWGKRSHLTVFENEKSVFFAIIHWYLDKLSRKQRGMVLYEPLFNFLLTRKKEFHDLSLKNIFELQDFLKQ